MIRINLLPYREIKKQETRSRMIFFLAAGMILYLLVLGGIQLYIWGSNRSLEADLKAKEEKLASLDKVVGEVDRYKKEKGILEKKLNVIG
jgi:Tfp pilus assembly protein PilN